MTEDDSGDRPGGLQIPPWLIYVVVGSVVAMWVGSLILDAFVKTYDPPAAISLAFMAIVSALLGGGMIRPLNKKRDRRNSTETEGDEE